jgi:hypothetical protein
VHFALKNNDLPILHDHNLIHYDDILHIFLVLNQDRVRQFHQLQQFQRREVSLLVAKILPIFHLLEKIREKMKK